VRLVCWIAAGLGWWDAGVVLSLCSGRPNGQEQCGLGGRLLAVGCLGSRSAEMHRMVRWTAGGECSLCNQLSGATQRGPVGLQASECGLCSRLSGAVQKSLVGLQAVNVAWTSHEIICFQPVLF
jgi:hypothetical protein